MTSSQENPFDSPECCPLLHSLKNCRLNRLRLGKCTPLCQLSMFQPHQPTHRRLRLGRVMIQELGGRIEIAENDRVSPPKLCFTSASDLFRHHGSMDEDVKIHYDDRLKKIIPIAKPTRFCTFLPRSLNILEYRLSKDLRL